MAPYTLYTALTPNGWKIGITLEELGLQYETRTIDMYKGEQKEPWFTKINPNGRIPALVDHEAGDLNVFETGAIMWYLTEKTDKEGKLWPRDLKKQAEVMSWVMFHMSGLQPMQGQAIHFLRFASDKNYQAMDRYVTETKRLLQVLDTHLQTREWLAANQFTIADISNFTWVYGAAYSGHDIEEFPSLKKWKERVFARPAVKRGMAVPTAGDLLRELTENTEQLLASAVETLSNAKQAAGK